MGPFAPVCMKREGGVKAGHTSRLFIVKAQDHSLVLPHTQRLFVQTAKKMAATLGSYTIPLVGVSIFIATLTYITYKLLSSYLHKWFEMKPIPQLEGTYPLVGNALQFKTNSGGKKNQHAATGACKG